MRWNYSPIRLLVLVGLLVAATQLEMAQSQSVRPVNIWKQDIEQVELFKGSYALVIGASDYQDNAWSDLTNIKEDIVAVSQALEEQGFQVQTRLDPTGDILLEEITDFINQFGIEEENRLLFYFAGHGYTKESNGYKFGFMVPVDAPSPQRNETLFSSKSLQVERILSLLEQGQSKHILFIFDSFLSDSVLQPSEVSNAVDNRYLISKPVRQFISAGSADQTVPDNSEFRALFIRGMRGQADLNQDGYLTGTELGVYLKQRVPLYQEEQVPYFGTFGVPKLSEGNFVLGFNRIRDPELEIMKLYIEVDKFQEDLDSHQTSWKTIKPSGLHLVYVGEVKNGLPNGKGTFIDPDGFRYVGELKNGRLHGQGILAMPHGDQYEGQYIEGQKHGQGTYTWSNGRKYVGAWEKNRATGQGIFTYPDGRKYIGAFRDNKFEGIGSLIFPDGRKYTGEWENGLLNGQGKFTHPDGRQYSGAWMNGLINGQGTFLWPNGEKYVGAFKDNKFHWQGTYLWPNGEKYIGNHKDGVADGIGTHTWPDGERYVGNHKDGFPNGQGTHTWPDGRIKRGIWKMGEFMGEHPVQLRISKISSRWPLTSAKYRVQKATDCVRCDSTASHLQDQQVKHNSKPSKARLRNQGREITAVWPKAELNSIGIPSTLLSR